MATETFGIGPSAVSANTGPNVGVDAKLQADGSVTIDGETTFDPAVDAVKVSLPDPDIDYRAGVGLPSEEDLAED